MAGLSPTGNRTSNQIASNLIFQHAMSFAFVKACEDNNLEKVGVLLEKNKELVHATDNSKDTGLHVACRRGNLDIINELLRNEADATAVNSNGHAPLSLLIDYYNDILNTATLNNGQQTKLTCEAAAFNTMVGELSANASLLVDIKGVKYNKSLAETGQLLGEKTGIHLYTVAFDNLKQDGIDISGMLKSICRGFETETPSAHLPQPKHDKTPRKTSRPMSKTKAGA